MCDLDRLRNELRKLFEEATREGDGSVLGDEDRDELETDYVEQDIEGSDRTSDDEDWLMDENSHNGAVVCTYDEDDDNPEGQSSESIGSVNKNEFYFGRDGETKWHLNPDIHQNLPLSDLEGLGPQGEAKNALTPAMALQCFIDDSMISKIVEYTNLYINKIRVNYERERDARLTDAHEIRALIGILYLAGVLNAGRGNLADMWDNSCGTGVESVYVTMGYKRFRFLIRTIRFDNIHDRDARKSVDKLAPFREIIDKFVTNCKNSYVPTDILTIDEQLVAFKGNCPFRVYMPRKRAKYGIKVFSLVSTINFYTTNLEVYLGNQPEGPFRNSNKTDDLVMRLVDHIKESGRNIICGDRITSVALASRLYEEKIALTGILSKSQPEIPTNFLPRRGREEKSSLFGFKENCTMVSYVPEKSKAIVAISTKQVETITTGEDRIPLIISAFNEAMHSIHTLEKMCSQHDVSRNSRRWPLTLFFYLLNVSGLNAMIVFKDNKNLDFVRPREFLKKLSFELMKPQMEHRISLEMIPKQIRTRGRLLLNLEDAALAQPRPKRPKTSRLGRCYDCGRSRNKSTRKSCIKCDKWVCGDHLNIVCFACME